MLKETRGWTNEECAERCGVSLKTWKQLINGQMTSPRFSMMCDISDGFDVTLDFFREHRDPRILHPDELDRVNKYRTLPVKDQIDVCNLIDARFMRLQDRIHNDPDYMFRLNLRQKLATCSIDEIKTMMEIYNNEKKK